VLSSKQGISKVYFTELPKDVQERFGYDAQKATDYSTQQSTALEQIRKQQEELKDVRHEKDQVRKQLQKAQP
jgi:hypothetical protein